MGKLLGSVVCSNKVPKLCCVVQVPCTVSVGLHSSSLLNAFFCLNVDYGFCMLGELIHRKHVFSEVRFWDENQRF